MYSTVVIKNVFIEVFTISSFITQGVLYNFLTTNEKFNFSSHINTVLYS